MAFAFLKSWLPHQPPQQMLALPKPDFNRSADPLRADFAHARFGNSCRTLTLTFPYANIPVYRHALSLGPERGWRVLEIVAGMPESNLPPRNSVVADKLDFISAMEHLAEWQEGQIKLGSAVDRTEAEKLGIAYFVAFGERENLAFDHLNQPHPTAQGEVATAGYFTDEARERAKTSIGLPAPSPVARDLFEIILSRPASAMQDFNALIVDAKNHAGMNDILSILKELSTALSYIFETKLFTKASTNKLAASHYTYSDVYYSEHSSEAAFGQGKYLRFLANNMKDSECFVDYFYRRVNDCRKLRDALDLTPEAKKAHEEIFLGFQIVFHSMASKYLAQYAQKDAANKLSAMNDAGKNIEKAEELFAALVPFGDNKFTVAAFALDDSKLQVPAIISALINNFDKTLKQSEKASADKKQLLLLSPPSI